MSEQSKEAVIKVLGIDLAKRSFHLFGVDGDGRQVLSKKLTRARLDEFVANLPPCTAAMEACGSAHLLSVSLIHRRFPKIYRIGSGSSSHIDCTGGITLEDGRILEGGEPMF